MTKTNPVAPANSTVEAVLEGGPADIPAESRIRRTAPAETKVKLPHRGGYEHFERAEQDAGSVPVVFWWTDRTTVAE